MKYPVAITCPYLPLKEPVEFSGWWLGALADYQGPWESTEFEAAVRLFLAKFDGTEGQPIQRPSLIVRLDSGADGSEPSREHITALQRAIGFATIYRNPPPPDEDDEYADDVSWRVTTADNADLWVQPLDTQKCSWLPVEHGFRMTTTTSGAMDNATFRVHPPIELHMPQVRNGITLDDELLRAVYETQLSPSVGCEGIARRIGTAIDWLLRSWMNTRSITWAERIVYQKTAAETLAGNKRANSRKEALLLRKLFETTATQEGEGVGIEGLLWRPNEPTYVRNASASPPEKVTAFEHWYAYFAKVRNGIIHDGHTEQAKYEHEDSPYNGWLLWVADRVLREAIAVQLGNCGFPAAWRQGWERASYKAYLKLEEDQAF